MAKFNFGKAFLTKEWSLIQGSYFENHFSGYRIEYQFVEYLEDYLTADHGHNQIIGQNPIEWNENENYRINSFPDYGTPDNPYKKQIMIFFL